MYTMSLVDINGKFAIHKGPTTSENILLFQFALNCKQICSNELVKSLKENKKF